MDYHMYSNVHGPSIMETWEKTAKESHDVDMVYRIGRMHGVMDVVYAFNTFLKGANPDLNKFLNDLVEDTSQYALGAILDDLDRGDE